MKAFFSRMFGALVLPLVMYSCSADLNMTLPQGPAGLSAYEIWVEAVGNGEIDWPSSQTGKDGFYLYMQGSAGASGVSGVNGRSAYELWADEVATGDLDDPNNVGQKWPVGQNSMQDFWAYLTGKEGVNGDSAYLLWKVAVASGLKNPHDNEGGNWPTNKTTMDDFWKYLRGRDGNDGKTIVIGSPNVMANPIAGVDNEYVNPQSGNVSYTVYDKSGNRAAAGTQVRNVPATLNGNIYTTDANGIIVIPKEDLPLDANVNEQWGSCEVQFAGESEWYTSAANTFVPNRMAVRLYQVAYRNPVVVNQDFLTIRVQIQRRTSASGSWGFTPSTLYNNAWTTVQAYRLTGGKDVDPSLDTSGSNITNDSKNFADAGGSYDIGFTMHTRNVIETGVAWSGTPYYFGIRSSAYGEVVYANAVFEANPPIQKVPMITNVRAQKVGESLYRIAADFDVAAIDTDYLFANGYDYNASNVNAVGVQFLSYYVDTWAPNSNCMELRFTKGTGVDQTTIVCNPVSIAGGGACKTDVGGGVPVGSTISLSCNNQLMNSRGNIGVLNSDGADGLVISVNGSNGGGTIPVTIVPSID